LMRIRIIPGPLVVGAKEEEDKEEAGVVVRGLGAPFARRFP
jgi:hypothetical protein